MPAENDVIQGALKLTGLMEECCFTSWQDFIKALPTLFSVEIPSDVTNVLVSPDNPRDDQRDYVWFRTNSAGGFIGMFIYATGQWRQIWPTPSGIFRMYGDSRYVPAGYSLADASNPHMTAAMAAALETQWVHDPTNTYYVVFDVTYVGF